MTEERENRCVQSSFGGNCGTLSSTEGGAFGKGECVVEHGLLTEDLKSACITQRIARLEKMTSEIGSLVEGIRTNMVYRALRKARHTASRALSIPKGLLRRGKDYIYRIKRCCDVFLDGSSKKLKYGFARMTRRYYFEDYVRVYPEGIAFDEHGRKFLVDETGKKNFLNHLKFYRFAAQFVESKRVADVGCGSGYGCELLKSGGAVTVYGSDISKAAIKFAKEQYGASIDFVVQGITDMKAYEDSFVDVAVCSEVLEHVKEYGAEHQAIQELKRITRGDGLMIMGTPNAEMLGDHGFSFEEMVALLRPHFAHFCIFENAFIPSGEARKSWDRRLEEGKVGVIISENINVSESVWTEATEPEIKQGLPTGKYLFCGQGIDTTLLHNTHSWVIVAKNAK